MKTERPDKSFAQRPNGDPRVQYAAIALSLMVFLALFSMPVRVVPSMTGTE